MYKLWRIFLMQLFNFTPLKCYDLCAGALALTMGGGGGGEVGVLRDWLYKRRKHFMSLAVHHKHFFTKVKSDICDVIEQT